MDKVSVLVAAYNAARTIGKCVDSLLAQTHREIEAVCIDDCSADGTLAILQDYAAKDSRVRVLRLDTNQGQARARNAGLQAATGSLICMLDADDWLAPDAIEQAVAVLSANPQTDTVLFDVVMEYADRSERYEMPPFDALTGREAFRLSLSWRIHGVYMTRAGIHKRIPYDTTCRAYSDDNTTRLHYLASREVRRCAGRYHYLQHPDSVTHAVSVRRFDHLRANESMRDALASTVGDQKLIAEYENQRWLNVVDAYMFYHCHGRQLTESEREYGIKEIERVWRTIDRKALDRRLAAKFGYRPMPSWRLFRLQEWAYFTLRGLLGKNK